MINEILKLAQKTLEIESQAVEGLINQLDANFNHAVEAILSSNGKLIITGMGKSGIIGKKIAATLASTGTPSFYIHPGEAFHGDLGMIESNDVILALSYSGETDEVLKLIPFFRSNRNTVISLTRSIDSTLGRNSDVHISVSVVKEACPHDLAPTSSTTATLAMGDALAVVLMNQRNFKAENFAIFHPGGSLGKRLLYRVEDVMTAKNLPLNKPNDDINELFYVISRGKLGISVVVDEDQRVLGLITDGELRRTMQKVGKKIFDLNAIDLMNPQPVGVLHGTMLTKAEEIMRATRYKALLVTDSNKRLVGILDISVIQSTF